MGVHLKRFQKLILAIEPEHSEVLQIMVVNVINKVKTRRAENLGPKPFAEKSSPALTNEEHQCFRECYEEFLSAITDIKEIRADLASQER
jgi:hypothetical protein